MGRKKKNPFVSLATILTFGYILTTPEGQEILKEVPKFLKAYRKKLEKDERTTS